MREKTERGHGPVGGGRTVTFNATEQASCRLSAAVEATGLNQTEVLLALIERFLPHLVREVSQRRAEAAQRFLAEEQPEPLHMVVSAIPPKQTGSSNHVSRHSRKSQQSVT